MTDATKRLLGIIVGVVIGGAVIVGAFALGWPLFK